MLRLALVLQLGLGAEIAWGIFFAASPDFLQNPRYFPAFPGCFFLWPTTTLNPLPARVARLLLIDVLISESSPIGTTPFLVGRFAEAQIEERAMSAQGSSHTSGSTGGGGASSSGPTAPPTTLAEVLRTIQLASTSARSSQTFNLSRDDARPSPSAGSGAIPSAAQLAELVRQLSTLRNGLVAEREALAVQRKALLGSSSSATDGPAGATAAHAGGADASSAAQGPAGGASASTAAGVAAAAAGNGAVGSALPRIIPRIKIKRDSLGGSNAARGLSPGGGGEGDHSEDYIRGRGGSRARRASRRTTSASTAQEPETARMTRRGHPGQRPSRTLRASRAMGRARGPGPEHRRSGRTGSAGSRSGSRPCQARLGG